MTSARTVVIAGASVAGVRCATALRGAGFDGTVVLLDAQEGAPYDKPQLSKRLAAGDELDLLADAQALVELDIDFRPGVTATGLDATARVIETSHGAIAFDDLVIATGCRPRPLPRPMPELAGFVRTRQDWEALKGAARRGGHLVVVGAGFLGLEAAAAASVEGMTVSVVDVAPRVLMRGIPRSAADLIAARHVAEGVELRLGVATPTLHGDDSGVWTGETRGHRAVVAVGALPNVEWLAWSGLVIDDGVVCDAGLRSAPGIWAIGDCARWVNTRYDRLERHEHWTTAVRQAQHVAGSIASLSHRPMGETPYVWSDQFDMKIQSVGRAGRRELHVSPREGSHVVLCVDDDAVTGVTTINAQAICVRARQLLQEQDPPLRHVVETLHLAELEPVSR